MDKPITRRPTYSTWAVFTIALSLLLGLMLFPALTARRRSERIYNEIRANQEKFQSSQRIFETLTRSVFTISVTIREFLLDYSPETEHGYRSLLHASWEQVRTSVGQLSRSLPLKDAVVLQRLDSELNGYWASIVPVLDWTPPQRAERGAYFLREAQRPRRQSILAITEELANLNLSQYREQQRRITLSEQQFREELLRSVLYALLAGLAVSAAGILRIRWLERRAREQHEVAEQTGEELRNLSTRLRHVQEEERRMISRELHDEVGQNLTAMRMELGALERVRTADPAEFGARLSEVKTLTEQSLRLIRDMAAGLRPSVLDDLGLGPALQNQAREFSRRTGTPVSVSVKGEFGGLSDRQSTYIYRIVQEALTNSSKHASARHVAIGLTNDSGRAELTVSDDGVGFDPAVANSGLGLIGIEERVRELDGTIAIQTAPGNGTTIRVSIPQGGNGDE